MRSSTPGRLTISLALSLLLHSWALWGLPPPLAVGSEGLPPLQARLLPTSPPADDHAPLSRPVTTGQQGEGASFPRHASQIAAGADRPPARSRRFHAAATELAAVATVPPHAPSEAGAPSDVDTAADAMRATTQQPMAAATGENASSLPALPAIAAAAQPSGANDGVSAANGGPAPPLAAGAAADIDGDSLRAYRLALAREARRFRHYPAQAREAGWHGRVTLRLGLAAPSPTLAVAKSSGREILDQAALAMMQQAAARVPRPATLRERAASLELTVEFDLTEP